MNDLSRLFVPVTAPPEHMGNYIEIAPTGFLRPYIRCFWGTLLSRDSCEAEMNTEPFIVVPDTCMDVIFELDYHSNMFSNVFCGINDTSFFNNGLQAHRSIFAVRFYFWAVHLFSDNSLKDTLNAFTDPQDYFSGLKTVFENIMLETASIRERIHLAEDYLIKKLHNSRKINNGLLNAVYYILKSRGTASVGDICSNVGISERQLERTFLEYAGVSPKKATELVRFQNVLREMLYHRCDIMDIVYNYGFTDQSHLINSFKKYSGRPPLKALEYFK